MEKTKEGYMDNDTINMLKDIKRKSKDNKLVIFIGAGVSNNSGYKSWDELVEIFDNKIKYSKEKHKYSSEELLKIPQYFFNENRDEYKNILKKEFDVIPALTNPIIDILLELKPNHIITTNFDKLIELSLNKNNIYGCPIGDELNKYQVICKDSDLISAPKNNFLIKMHGDLDNFESLVLKEDDYLKYSSTHVLIETYIKSLLIGHTFLFVGYSLGDYNLKLIMSWVEDIIKKYKFNNKKMINKHYFINPSTQVLNKYEKEYYKNKNILVIEGNEIPEDYLNLPVKNISHPLGKNLYNICKYMVNYDYINKGIDDIYDDLLSFNNVDRITFKELLNLLQEDSNINFNINSTYYYNLKYSSNIFKDCIKILTEKKQSDKLEDITKIFNKANITKLFSQDDSSEIKIGSELRNEISEYMISFNFCKLLEFKDKLKKSNNTKNILHYIYLELYFGNENNEIKDKMNAIIEKLKQEKDYFNLIISEYNATATYSLGRYVYKNILNELEKDYKKKYATLFEYLSGFSEMYSEISEIKMKIIQKFSPYSKWRFTECNIKNLEFKKFRRRIESILLYLFDNCIIFQRFNGFNLKISNLDDILYSYIDTLLYLNSPEVKIGNNFDEKDMYQRESIKKIDVFIMVRYLESAKLKFLIDNYGVDNFELDIECQSYVVDILYNIVDSLEFMIEADSPLTINIVENVIFIITKIKFSNNQYERIFQNYINLLNKLLDMNNEYDYSTRFNLINDYWFYLRDILEKYNSVNEYNSLVKFINDLLTNIINMKDEKSRYLISLFSETYLLYNIAEIVKKHIKERIAFDLLVKFKEYLNKYFRAQQIPIIFQLYGILGSELQKEVEEFVKNTINDIPIELLYISACNNSLKYDDEVQKRLLLLCDNNSRKINSENNISNPFYVVIKLVESNTIKVISPFKKYKGFNDFFDFVCFPDEFDFAKFNTNWTGWLTKDKYLQIARKKAYKILQRKYKETLLNGATELQKYIYYKYFCEK